MKKEMFLISIILICFLIGNIFAFNFEEPDYGLIIEEEVITFNNITGSVNRSNYWGSHFYTDYDLLVPYTGADKNVDLGSQNLTTTGRITTKFLEIINQGAGANPVLYSDWAIPQLRTSSSFHTDALFSFGQFSAYRGILDVTPGLTAHRTWSFPDYEGDIVVTPFKADINTTGDIIAKSASFASPDFPVVLIERITGAATAVYSANRYIRTHSTGLADGAGISIYFGLDDAGGTLRHAGSFGSKWINSTNQTMALVFGARDYGGDSGATGYNDRMLIYGTGDVEIPYGNLKAINNDVTLTLQSKYAPRTPKIDFLRSTGAFGTDAYADWRIIDSAGDLDFIVGLNNVETNVLSLTYGGAVGIGTATPHSSGTELHVYSGDSGVTVPWDSRHNLIVEGTGTTGISILTPDNNVGSLVWGSPSDNNHAYIDCEQLTESMYIGAGGVQTMALVSGDVGILTTTPTHELNVVGDVNITGNGIFGGNVTAENVFLPAYISVHTNSTIAVASAGVWYNVTFDHEADEFKKRITHATNDNTNTTFTIQDTGMYELTYTMIFEDSAASPNAHIVTRVTKNDVELNGFTIEKDSTKQNSDFGLHHSDLVELSVNDKIKLSFTSDDTTVSLITHLTYGDHKNTGHLTIKRIA